MWGDNMGRAGFEGLGLLVPLIPVMVLSVLEPRFRPQRTYRTGTVRTGMHTVCPGTVPVRQRIEARISINYTPVWHTYIYMALRVQCTIHTMHT